LGKEAAFAIETRTARYMMKTHHTVAELPLRHIAADRYDRAGHFVPQNLRRWHIRVINLLDVGAANAASSNFDENFAVADFRTGTSSTRTIPFSRYTPARIVLGIGLKVFRLPRLCQYGSCRSNLFNA